MIDILNKILLFLLFLSGVNIIRHSFFLLKSFKDGKRFAKISFDDRATKVLKNLGIDMEIPRGYDTAVLDKIVDELKEKGIDADHDAAMDVS